MTACYCGSNVEFAGCCEKIINKTKIAATPLEVMRSRYTAHVLHNIEHIIRTMRGKALKLFDQEKTIDEWFENTTWQKLEIINAPEIKKNDKEGIVEFKAHYIFNNAELVLHERSKFLKIDGEWYYVSGQNKGANIQVSDKVVGRNDPCACGSGLKFKKCCASP